METSTPLERAPLALCEYAGSSDLWLKREDVHELGVFKWRGALPVVEALARAGHEAVVTASTGNHGAATAWAGQKAGIPAIVFVPSGAAETKLANLERLGADIRVAGSDIDEAKDAARAFAEDAGLRFFEDGAEPLQYDAYGAIADEILDQSSTPPAAVVTPIGNGALAGGIGAALGRREPAIRRVGVVPKEMPVMAASHEAGMVVDVAAGTTIADGLGVRVAVPLAVERLQDAVDEMVRVSERAIAAALVASTTSASRSSPRRPRPSQPLARRPPPTVTARSFSSSPAATSMRLSSSAHARKPRRSPTERRLTTAVDWDWTRIVFDHVHIRVRDPEASVAFYRAALAVLDIPPVWESDDGAQFAILVVTGGEPATSGPVHIAFVADTREQVDAFHRAGIDAGGRDNGAPGVREQYSSDEGGRYYAAFVLDPDGNNVEAVRREF